MTKVVEILNGEVHCEYPQYGTAEEASACFAPSIVFVDAPDWVHPGYYTYDGSKEGDERFTAIPINETEGWVYGEDGWPWNPTQVRADERLRLHSETANDTLQALRKLREGDTSIDWQAWLDALDAYNAGIEATKEQDSYPLKVTYPEYPTKPGSDASE